MVRSLPELARAWWTLDVRWPVVSSTRRLLERPLVPAYRVPHGLPAAEQRERVARVINLLADRLARVSKVWREWDVFDVEGFFDLYPSQAEVLVEIQETRSQVMVTLYADLLCPVFQAAETFWTERVLPALHVAQPVLFSHNGQSPDPAGDMWAEELAHHLAPEMERRLYAAAEEINAIRELLYRWGSVDFLITSAAREERERIARSLDGQVASRVWERLRLVPTLTLQLAFAAQPEHARRRRALLRWRRQSWRRSHAR